MSTTTERILIAVLLIIAVLFAMRDAHGGMFGKCEPYGSEQADNATIGHYE